MPQVVDLAGSDTKNVATVPTARPNGTVPDLIFCKIIDDGQASDQTIADVGSSSHPHVVTYGSGLMRLAWESGSSMTAQIRDAGTGATDTAIQVARVMACTP
jgi:hypothetical protein